MSSTFLHRTQRPNQYRCCCCSIPVSHCPLPSITRPLAKKAVHETPSARRTCSSCLSLALHRQHWEPHWHGPRQLAVAELHVLPLTVLRRVTATPTRREQGACMPHADDQVQRTSKALVGCSNRDGSRRAPRALALDAAAFRRASASFASCCARYLREPQPHAHTATHTRPHTHSHTHTHTQTHAVSDNQADLVATQSFRPYLAAAASNACSARRWMSTRAAVDDDPTDLPSLPCSRPSRSCAACDAPQRVHSHEGTVQAAL